MKFFHHYRINNWILLALVVVNVLVLAFLLLSKHPNRPKPHHPPMLVADFLASELQLDANQTQTFKQLRQAHFAQTKTIHQNIRRQKKAMIAAFTSSPPDQARAQELAQQIGELQVSIDLLLIQHFEELRAVCTPVQQQKLSTLFQKAFNRHPPPPR
ncbi:MAG: periplasmic heavy metal sensor [Bacteroidota bacterium]